MSKVLVDRELLERCVDRWACCAIAETPGAEQAWLELRAVVKAAQPAEAEGVQLRRYTPISQGDHMPAMNSCDQGGWVRHSDYLAALSAVTAERDRLRDQVKVLQSDANSWQSGYDKGRHDGTKHRQIEVDRLRAEVEAMRKVIRAALYYVPEHKHNLREIMSAAMAAKEA